MSDLTPLQQRRRRAFAVLEKYCDKHTPMLIDYHIDSFCRDVLDLPVKPKDADPYEGWLPLTKPPDAEGMTTSDKGIELIKQFEGFRNQAYLCPAGVWTIGYGHTKAVKPGMVISSTRGEVLLREDLRFFEATVNQSVKVPLNQNQFDALVSLCYNIGSTAFNNSTLLKLLNKSQYDAAQWQFLRWVNGGGRQLPGLVKRRQAERDLFRA